ncbi:MAG: hypothetical protein ACKOEQ_04125 [Verrucomicrobiota bacterium]
MGFCLLPDVEGVPDRQAVDLLLYHAGWNVALNRQLGDDLFHPTTLTRFRDRLQQYDLAAVGFKAILDGLLGVTPPVRMDWGDAPREGTGRAVGALGTAPESRRAPGRWGPTSTFNLCILASHPPLGDDHATRQRTSWR